MENKDVIVINRMYTGDYLDKNLGHEVINMFTADNGGHYIYLNAYGNFAEVHKDKVGHILLVKNNSENEFEILGYATGIEDVYDAEDKFVDKYDRDLETDVIYKKQREYIIKNQITYGEENSGKPFEKKRCSILSIFNDAEQQSIFITYKAQEVWIPMERMFIRYGENTDCNSNIITLNGYKYPSTSLKSYIYPEGTYKGDNTLYKIKAEDKPKIIEARKLDYIEIKKIIDNEDLWVKASTDEQRKENKTNGYKGFEKIEEFDFNIQPLRELSLFDICRIQDDENRFTAALEHFIEKYKELFEKFFDEKYEVKLFDNLKVEREKNLKIDDTSYGRIDLFITDENNIVVVENKIKSGINKTQIEAKSRVSGNQLVRYKKYVDLVKGKKNAKFFILLPNYSEQIIKNEIKNEILTGKVVGLKEDDYTTITYKTLYDFLMDNISVWSKDNNMRAFVEAMKRHTYGNDKEYLYYEMQEKFYRRVSELK